jgi:hypothetical protein
MLNVEHNLELGGDMATLVWDQVGERVYQTGVDHGVLYLHDGTVAVWNGLTSVEESSDSELKVFYLDGVKYLENLIPGDFSGTLKAFTYPDEFDAINGIATFSPGLSYYNQPSKSFNLSYRTQIGDDIAGTERGYKIHILYNIIAIPDSYALDTAKDSGVEPVEFGWSLSGTPSKIDNYRPTVHISINSIETPPEILKILEDKLYGTDTTGASLPSIQDIAEYFGYLGALIIIDHGDGSWSAIDEANTYISMIDDTTFQIDDADASYLDPDTYKISSTNVG